MVANDFDSSLTRFIHVWTWLKGLKPVAKLGGLAGPPS